MIYRNYNFTETVKKALNIAERITVKAEKLHDRRAYVSVDGTDGFELANEDVVIVRNSAKTANLIYLGERSFYDSTFDKLQYRVD